MIVNVCFYITIWAFDGLSIEMKIYIFFHYLIFFYRLILALIVTQIHMIMENFKSINQRSFIYNR